MRLVLAHSHANTLGGGERALLEVARALSQRHDVRVLLGGFDARRTYPELAGLAGGRLARWQWPLTRVVADAIVANSFGANLLALRNGPRTAYWVHSTRSIFLQADAHRLDLRLRRVVDWLAVRRAGQLIANSQYAASRLWQLYRREADAIVYPGVDLNVFRPGPPRGDYAITVGRLAPEKGLDRLFDLWRDLPDLPLHVVGSGVPEFTSQLQAAAPGNVRFRGQLTANDLAIAYQRAAVAVFAPRGEEFGMAPLEAMACGVPVVAWREGGLVETIIDGETGFLVVDAVTFRQRVRLLARDVRLREALGDGARQRASSFTWQRTAEGIEQVCLRLAAATPPRAPAV